MSEKVALILTGHMRCWKDVFPNIKERILDRWDTDVFISTWDTEGYWCPPESDPEGHGINLDSPMISDFEVREYYGPIRYMVDSHTDMILENDLNKFANKLQPHCIEIRAKNIVSQFYKIHQGYSMFFDHVMSTGAQYDHVIRMRPDLVLGGELPEIKMTPVNFFVHTNHQGDGVGDMYLGTNQYFHSMFYAKLLNYKAFVQTTGRFCPHIITKSIIMDVINSENIHYMNELKIPKTLMHTPSGQYSEAYREEK